jgi:signal transduction histidine kinase
MAVFTAIAWVIAELRGAATYSRPSIAYVNATTRLTFFLMAVTLLSAFKDLSTRLGILVEQRTRSLRRLASQLSEAEDSERSRLAYDIHDGLSQNLSVLKMSLAATLPQTTEGTSSRQRITDALALVDDLIDRTRTLTFDLHPAMLDHLGLVPTLRRYAEQFSPRANVEVLVSEDGDPRRLPGPIANYLFRSAKELFNNAAKHGHARQIVAVVHWSARHVRIVIDDDGGGFDAAEAFNPGSAKGLGLAGMRERLLSLGGGIRLESTAGQGTRVVVELPLADQEISK